MHTNCPHCGFSLTQTHGYKICNICGWWMENEAAFFPASLRSQQNQPDTENRGEAGIRN